MDGADVIADEGLADRLDDRDAARRRRLEEDRHLVRRGGLENLPAVLGEQRLVAGDDDLAALDGAEDQLRAGFMPPMSSTTTWMSGSSSKSSQRVVKIVAAGAWRAPGRVAHGDFLDGQLSPEAFHEQDTVVREVFVNPGADIAHPRETDLDLLHLRF